MNRWLLLTVFGFVSTLACMQKNPKQPSQDWFLPIQPHPQEIRLKKESGFTLNSATTVTFYSTSAFDSSDVEVELLNSFLSRHNHNLSNVVSINKINNLSNAIFIGESFNNSNLSRLLSQIGVDTSADYPGPEGYVLDISEDAIILVGHDSSGTFYGLESLLQIMAYADSSGHESLPAVTIIDYPDMPLRSAFYGYYLSALENDARLKQAYNDFKRIAQFKFNMIDLGSHHYGHLEMAAPEHEDEKLWQRFEKLHQKARRYHLQPRVGGWAKWVNTDSPWGADLTTLECIRTSQAITMKGTPPYTLKISSGHKAPNVIFDFETGHSWEKEPVTVTDESGTITYVEGQDYIVNFGEIHSEDYRKYYSTYQTDLEVLFSSVHYGEGEPEGYPLRWGETFNPPTTIQRLKEGRIEDGQKVTVNFSYIGPDPWSLIKVRYCRSDERLYTDGPENYIWRWCRDPVRLLGADDFTLDADETRVLAWDKRCLDSGKTRSRIWADDIHYYYKTIRAAAPNARISMWSDMIDPAHNAELYGTQNAASLILEYGMDDIIMIPWKSSIAEQSIKFLAEKGFAIMPSCQNETEEGYSTAPKWAYLLREFYSDKVLPRGLMHCHWGYAFNSEKTWEQLATVADHAWSAAPYILHQPVTNSEVGKDIKITAQIEGDEYVFDGEKVRRGPLPIETAKIYYKCEQDSAFSPISMYGKDDIFQAIIPAAKVVGADIQYYITVSDKFNMTRSPKSTGDGAYKISIIKS